jgi:hypothetical protein
MVNSGLLVEIVVDETTEELLAETENPIVVNHKLILGELVDVERRTDVDETMHEHYNQPLVRRLFIIKDQLLCIALDRLSHGHHAIGQGV